MNGSHEPVIIVVAALTSFCIFIIIVFVLHVARDTNKNNDIFLFS